VTHAMQQLLKRARAAAELAEQEILKAEQKMAQEILRSARTKRAAAQRSKLCNEGGLTENDIRDLEEITRILESKLDPKEESERLGDLIAGLWKRSEQTKDRNGKRWRIS
jgi:hypothetical protein